MTLNKITCFIIHYTKNTDRKKYMEEFILPVLSDFIENLNGLLTMIEKTNLSKELKVLNQVACCHVVKNILKRGDSFVNQVLTIV